MTVEINNLTEISPESSGVERWLQEPAQDGPFPFAPGCSKEELRKRADILDERHKRGEEHDNSTRLQSSTTPVIHSYGETSRPLPFRSNKQPSTSAHTLPGQQENDSQSKYHKDGQKIGEMEHHATTHQPPAPTYRCSIRGCEYEGSHLEEERAAHIRTYHSHETDEAKIESCTESSIEREMSDDEAAQSSESDDQMAVAYAKHQIIDKLMEKFYAIFNPRWEAAGRFHTAPESGGPSAQSHQPLPQSSNAAPHDREKRKRRRRNSSSRRDPNGKRGAGSLSDPKDGQDKVQYACPYHKYNPQRYCPAQKNYKSCMNGFATISNVKQHLRRTHLAPIYCSRCWTVFKTSAEERVHANAEERCEVRNAQPEQLEKMTQDRSQMINGRYGTTWEEIYRILFPGAPVPNPYFQPYIDPPCEVGSSLGAPGPSQTYEEYDLTELAPLFLATLQATVTVEMTRVEQERHFMNVLQRCQRTLRHRYQDMQAEQSVANERPQSRGRERSLPDLLTSEAGLASQSPISATNNTSAQISPEPPHPDAEADVIASSLSNHKSPQKTFENQRPELSYEPFSDCLCPCHLESQPHTTQRGEQECEECKILHENGNADDFYLLNNENSLDDWNDF